MAKKSGRAVPKKKKQSRRQDSKTIATEKPARTQQVRLPSVWQLTKTAYTTLWQHKKLFISITLIYGVLNLLLVQGLTGGTDVGSLKHALSQAYNGNFNSLASALGVFSVLVGSTGNSSNQAAGAYQLPLGIVTSLAVIWALRQVLADKKIRIRDAYYSGMYPLIPFVLVIIVIGVQLLPFIIGSSLYSLVAANGIAVGALERAGWLLVFLSGMAWSIYMVSSSLFAIYIVTLPDITPLQALRSASKLVKGKRWAIILRLAFLPLVLLVAAAVIMVPIIITLTFLAKWVFFLLTTFTLVAVHTYMYTLYRELLNE
jgi:hypothetical protein